MSIGSGINLESNVSRPSSGIIMPENRVLLPTDNGPPPDGNNGGGKANGPGGKGGGRGRGNRGRGQGGGRLWDDPVDYANTVFLCSFDGANLSQANVDESFASHGALTYVEQCWSDTAVVKFGSASLRVQGNDDGAYLADHADWTFGENVAFTIEAWVFPLNRTTSQDIVTHYNPSTNNRSWKLRVNITTGKLQLTRSLDGTGTTALISDNVVAEDAWTHVACTRDVGGTIRLFIGGVLDAQTASESGAFFNSNSNLYVGTNHALGTNSFFGYLDEVRITRNQAAYTETFAPPTNAFARS